MVNPNEMASLVVDALIGAKIIDKNNLDKAIEIAEDEINARICIGGIGSFEETFKWNQTGEVCY